MIPVYHCAHLLREALESVLAQDPGADQMQIEVLDNCSTNDDPEVVVRNLGKGRVAFFRQSSNIGVVGNYNSCLQRSRGHIVHILHADDYVLPGFYEQTARLLQQHQNAAAVFVRTFVVGQDRSIEWLSPRLSHLEVPSRDPGMLLYINHIFAPGAVVRRSFYENHGGYKSEFVHVPDWEMWVRAICTEGAVYLNSPLCAWRYSEGNDTSQLARRGDNCRDCLKLIPYFERYWPEFDPNRFRAEVSECIWRQAEKFRSRGDGPATEMNMRLWHEITPIRRRIKKQVLRLIRAG
jgi:glycosyltransferase involved in cell wall biosynthesis